MTEAPTTDTQVSTREVPWMKLGKLADEPMTAAKAAKLGGLDFQVEKCELFYETTAGDGKLLNPVKERRAIVRVDTGTWLGIMSKDYTLLQYGEAFDFMDTVNPRYVAAGALKGGRRGSMVVSTGTPINILDGDDPHELYAVLRTSHDGTRAIEVAVMPLRGLCMNQLTLQSFTKSVPHRWAVRHTGNVQLKLHDAVESVKHLEHYAAALEKTAERLALMQITDDIARTTLEAALPDRPRRAEQVEQIISTWHTAETVGFDWTGWGLVTATSDYFDWQRTGGSPESRFVGALQGQTHNAINRVAGRLLSRV
jgi:phage/plasmid-like protein (TIGR03299 family)